MILSLAIDMDPTQSLDISWGEMAASLQSQGADVEQINAMRMVFFAGAAMVFTRVKLAAKTDHETFVAVMAEMFEDIDAVMTDGLLSAMPEGHA